MVIADPAHSGEAVRALGAVALGDVQVSDNGRHLAAGVAGGTGELSRVLAALQSAAVDVLDIGLRRPTMDDVFLSLTGRPAEEAEALDETDEEAS
jgi:ABC-2 type transport system ATP-binding protein